MHIAVCEDLKKDAGALCALLRQYCEENQVAVEISCVPSAEALLEGYRPGMYHILFLDILLEGVNGVEAARRIRQMDQEVAIIFVTVSREFAVDSYTVDAAFYLVKPVDMGSLSQAMERCRHLLHQHVKSISVAESRHMVDVRLKDVLYVESQRNDCILHTCQGEIRTRAKLTELEEVLGGPPFLRCHRSFVVNLYWLADMLDKDFLLKTGVRVPISRAYGAASQEAFRQFLLTDARRGTGGERIGNNE